MNCNHEFNSNFCINCGKIEQQLTIGYSIQQAKSEPNYNTDRCNFLIKKYNLKNKQKIGLVNLFKFINSRQVQDLKQSKKQLYKLIELYEENFESLNWTWIDFLKSKKAKREIVEKIYNSTSKKSISKQYECFSKL